VEKRYKPTTAVETREISYQGEKVFRKKIMLERFLKAPTQARKA